MKTTLDEIEKLVEESEKNPWAFYVGKSLKDLLRDCHPDRWTHDREKATDLFKRFGVSHKQSLTPQRTIQSPKRLYSIVRELAMGDLRIIHELTNGWLLKEPRASGKAVNNLVAKESEILQQLTELAAGTQYAYYFPHLMETFTHEEKRINVTFYDRRLVTAAQIKSKYPQGISGRHIGWMFKRLLTGLGYVHNKGWIHGAVTPEHVMFSPENHAGVLAGWIHAEKPGNKIKTIPSSRKDYYPEDAKKGLTSGVDIYMAGKVMMYLANPEEVPKRIWNFLKATQLSASMRPQDAWELEDEFSQVLSEVYGAPKFVELSI